MGMPLFKAFFATESTENTEGKDKSKDIFSHEIHERTRNKKTI